MDREYNLHKKNSNFFGSGLLGKMFVLEFFQGFLGVDRDSSYEAFQTKVGEILVL